MNSRLSNLDLLRGIAALAVCAGHLRAFLLVDFGQVQDPGVLDRVFYLATGLGHQAVMVFFVLSGYLVGGSVLTAHQQGRWSWRDYSLRRITRLWVVLLPALILTLMFDAAGHHWAPAGYEGAYAAIHSSGPTPDLPIDWRASTFVGNALFLQTILVNSFGTNGPLWSLAYEFWYYLLFPLLSLVLMFPNTRPYRVSSRVLYAVVMIALVVWLPSGLVLSGLIWLLGVGAFWVGRLESARRVCGHPAWLLGAGVWSMATLAASKYGSVFGSDWSIGIAFALWVTGLASTRHQFPWFGRVCGALSDMSYTLYVVHFPMLAFVFYVPFGAAQFQPALMSYLRFAAILAGTLAFARLVWWCFERNTVSVRRRIELAFPPRRFAGGPIPPARP